jgi:hypothetical protein
LEKSLFPRF